MAEWQTHKTQNLAEVTSCGFKSHYPQSKKSVKSRVLTIGNIYYSYYFCYYAFARSKCFFFYTLPAHFILEFNVLLIAWILFLLWNSAVVVLLTAQSDILEAYTLPLSSRKTYSPNQPFLNSNFFTFLNTLAISSINGITLILSFFVEEI